MLGWDTAAYAARVRAFGWRAIEIDGHDVDAIDRAYAEAIETDGRPVAILARTVKGKGVAAIEDRDGFHGKPLADPGAAIAELGGPRTSSLRRRRSRAPPPAVRACAGSGCPSRAPRRAAGDAPRVRRGAPRGRRRRATRRRHGRRGRQLDVLRALSRRLPRTASSRCMSPSSRWPRRRSDCRRAGHPVRLDLRGVLDPRPRLHSDGRVSRADIRLVGSHTGVTVGEDGPSQMALEDIAMLRAIHGCTVWSLRRQPDGGPGRRVARPSGRRLPAHATHGDPRIYPPGERFPIGGSRTCVPRPRPVTLLGAGVTVHEALAAADTSLHRVRARVIDLYSVKPLDTGTVIQAASTPAPHRRRGPLGPRRARRRRPRDAGRRRQRVPFRLAVHDADLGRAVELLRWRHRPCEHCARRARSPEGVSRGAHRHTASATRRCSMPRAPGASRSRRSTSRRRRR